MDMTGLRSAQFDDIYFSPEDGLAETRYVFLDNNNLPAAWIGQKRFAIAETGFGTGLNFLAAWTLFEQTADPDAVLDYVSFELYPLAAGDILKTLSHWSGLFGGRLERMVEQYPLRITGWHRINFGRVRLTLVFDDVNAALPRFDAPGGIDAWFLDGFAPAKNPLMWSDIVFSNMARLSHSKTTLASFTAAGLAKDGLRKVGFHIEKRKGYGRKRDMISGIFQGRDKPETLTRLRRIAILGGGLAGAACAFILRERGMTPTVFETAAQLGAGASGNFKGIYNPRFSAKRSMESDFYASAFAMAARTISPFQCGSLHLITDEDKAKRFQSCQEHWGWHSDHMQALNTADASDICGIKLSHDALYLPDSGQVSPRDVVTQWLEGIDVRLSSTVSTDQCGDYDAVIYACGADIRTYIPDLPVHTVRGQIIEMPETNISAKLKTNLCFGGYIGASDHGRHVIGSTFQKWLTGTETRDEDTRDILAKLDETIPGFGFHTNAMTQARASLRCAANDHVPIIGAIPDRPGHYISTAHGSHGIVSSLMGAHVIADLIEGHSRCLPADTVNHLSLQRFLARRQKS